VSSWQPPIFKVVTNTVAVCVYQAVAIAVIARIRIRAGTVVVRSVSVVVASCVVLATSDLKVVANAVAVCVYEAVAVAVITRIRIRAGTVCRP
jgi:hypothetical protein